ncbi:hypothetical protein KBC04_04395 [Candidatus Babeliales bacterium]|nr:hypothetical protein [Candidatus Babeliales bacterium]MBP9844306.1 hypothetical protein [Candidatus Babeliales bacterium]
MKNIIKNSLLYFIFFTSTITLTTQFYDNDHIIELKNKDELQNLLKNNLGPCLIYFYMNNCGWCSKIGPIIEELSQSKQFLHAITFYKVNGPQTQAAELVPEYLQKKIQGYPTIFFMNKGELFDTQVGGANKETMITKLQALLKVSQ